jgi:hypothetical protein
MKSNLLNDENGSTNSRCGGVILCNHYARPLFLAVKLPAMNDECSAASLRKRLAYCKMEALRCWDSESHTARPLSVRVCQHERKRVSGPFCDCDTSFPGFIRVPSAFMKMNLAFGQRPLGQQRKAISCDNRTGSAFFPGKLFGTKLERHIAPAAPGRKAVGPARARQRKTQCSVMNLLQPLPRCRSKTNLPGRPICRSEQRREPKNAKIAQQTPTLP